MTTQFKIPTEYIDTLKKDRQANIDRLMKGGADKFYATMVYDFEQAPISTNRDMLSKCGIEIPNEDLVTDEQAERIIHKVRTCLLEVWHINFERTDHMDPRSLYRKFVEIIDEQVRVLVPCPEAFEVVVVDQHPDVFWKHYATENERLSFAERFGRNPPPYETPKWDRDNEFAKKYKAMKPDLPFETQVHIP